MKLAFITTFIGFSFLGTAQETFSYREKTINSEGRKHGDMAICLDNGSITIASAEKTGTLRIANYEEKGYNEFAENTYPVFTEPHEIITLKNGGYALAGRNLFMITTRDMIGIKSAIGTQMPEWRADNSLATNALKVMADWKQNGIGTSNTAIDFVELAESPDGNYVCAAFLFHKWIEGEAKMCWGLAISDLTQNGKMSTVDLNLVYTGSEETILEISKYFEIACLDNNHLLIGHNNQMMVFNFRKAVDGTAAYVWSGSLHDFQSNENAYICSFFADNGTTYFAMADDKTNSKVIVVGKAAWDGSKLSVVQKSEIAPGYKYINNPQILTNLSSDYFMMSGSSASSITSYGNRPYFVKVKKSDLSIAYNADLVVVDDKNAPCILDVCPLSTEPKKEKLIILLRGKHTDKTPGSFFLITLQFLR